MLIFPRPLSSPESTVCEADSFTEKRRFQLLTRSADFLGILKALFAIYWLQLITHRLRLESLGALDEPLSLPAFERRSRPSRVRKLFAFSTSFLHVSKRRSKVFSFSCGVLGRANCDQKDCPGVADPKRLRHRSSLSFHPNRGG